MFQGVPECMENPSPPRDGVMKWIKFQSGQRNGHVQQQVGSNVGIFIKLMGYFGTNSFGRRQPSSDVFSHLWNENLLKTKNKKSVSFNLKEKVLFWKMSFAKVMSAKLSFAKVISTKVISVFFAKVSLTDYDEMSCFLRNDSVLN